MAVIFTAIFFVVLVRLPEFYSLDKIAKSKSENTINFQQNGCLLFIYLILLSVVLLHVIVSKAGIEISDRNRNFGDYK
ncbi:Uncharacterised protein [uncultured archaeon]|nr:Uncharacterised protein [uncultured archaeon]